MANCRPKYEWLDQISPLSDIFEQKSCILKSEVTAASFNQKRANKIDNITFPKSISSLSFQGTTMIHDVN